MKCLWVPILENSDENWGWVAKHGVFKDGDIIILRESHVPHRLTTVCMPVEDEEEPFNYHFCEFLGVEELSSMFDDPKTGNLLGDCFQAVCIGREEDCAAILKLLSRRFPLLESQRPLAEPLLGQQNLRSCNAFALQVADIGTDMKDSDQVKDLLLWIRDGAQLAIKVSDYRVSMSPVPEVFIVPNLTLTVHETGEVELLPETIIEISDGAVTVFAIVARNPHSPFSYLRIVEPALTEIFKKHVCSLKQTPSQKTTATSESQSTPTHKITKTKVESWSQDASISLGHWTASQEHASSPHVSSTMDCDMRTHNKNMLKKLLLLSLRHVGVDKHHAEFASIWKHLYCGCLFAFRRELACAKIEQSQMLSVIRSNMNFLNIK